MATVTKTKEPENVTEAIPDQYEDGSYVLDTAHEKAQDLRTAIEKAGTGVLALAVKFQTSTAALVASIFQLGMLFRDADGFPVLNYGRTDVQGWSEFYGGTGVPSEGSILWNIGKWTYDDDGNGVLGVDRDAYRKMLSNMSTERWRQARGIVDTFVWQEYFKEGSEAREALGNFDPKWSTETNPSRESHMTAVLPLAVRSKCLAVARANKLEKLIKFYTDEPTPANSGNSAAGKRGPAEVLKDAVQVIGGTGEGSEAARLACFDIARLAVAIASRLTDPATMNAGFPGRDEALKDLTLASEILADTVQAHDQTHGGLQVIEPLQVRLAEFTARPVPTV